jgi:hypothetical protein
MKSIQNNTVDKAKKEQLIRWASEEISRREYTQKEINTMLYLAKKGKKQDA